VIADRTACSFMIDYNNYCVIYILTTLWSQRLDLWIKRLIQALL